MDEIYLAEAKIMAVLVSMVIIGGLSLAYVYTRQRTAHNALLAAQREWESVIAQSELQGQQKERLRIAKEMHDDLGASLTAVCLLSEVLKGRMGTATMPEVEKIAMLSSDMMTSMNQIIWSMNTSNDSLNGLIAYTRNYASEFIEHTALTLTADVTESADDLPMQGVDRRNVFLTVKEALHNVVKHAHASQVLLRVQPQAGQLLIEICDNGRGFSPIRTPRVRNGLANMQTRMTESGGGCEILPSPTGTNVTISYPYAPVPTSKIRQT